jgi:hypothetical protein
LAPGVKVVVIGVCRVCSSNPESELRSEVNSPAAWKS